MAELLALPELAEGLGVRGRGTVWRIRFLGGSLDPDPLFLGSLDPNPLFTESLDPDPLFMGSLDRETFIS